jgi:hypothetical protein
MLTLSGILISKSVRLVFVQHSPETRHANASAMPPIGRSKLIGECDPFKSRRKERHAER